MSCELWQDLDHHYERRVDPLGLYCVAFRGERWMRWSLECRFPHNPTARRLPDEQLCFNPNEVTAREYVLYRGERRGRYYYRGEIAAVMTWWIAPGKMAPRYLQLEEGGVKIRDFRVISGGDKLPPFVVGAGLTTAMARNYCFPEKFIDCRLDYGRWVREAGGADFFREAIGIFARHAPEGSWFVAGAQGFFPVARLGDWNEYVSQCEIDKVIPWGEVRKRSDGQVDRKKFGVARPQSLGTRKKYERIGPPWACPVDGVANTSFGPVWASELKRELVVPAKKKSDSYSYWCPPDQVAW